ncbi:E3 ubiquitin ligase PQT3-like isoform X2 [Phoenix dactylifera]|uniref:E3 ubiquitin ligase PQT3-like isoform X2 n=1 Tax=Phoenix dactylifera TaxID=42345 RepID=A0A8B9AQC3_PHODC|nr:E3 ubiquitin ligase PQT3-like isoform X2 [Phoenix dactylifera]
MKTFPFGLFCSLKKAISFLFLPGKKKKKKKTRMAASDMQWRAYQDFGAENFAGMPLAASGYNPYWAGSGMPFGVDGYMASFTGPMQYMGYTPGPFDVPFGGGILPQDPFTAQSSMMPVVPRDLSDLGIVGMNQGHGYLTREEFEAKKADLRWKCEMDRLNERERERSKDREPRREPNGTNGVSSLKLKPVRLLLLIHLLIHFCTLGVIVSALEPELRQLRMMIGGIGLSRKGDFPRRSETPINISISRRCNSSALVLSGGIHFSPE